MSAIKIRYSPEACSLAPHVLLHEIGVIFDAVEGLVAHSAELKKDFAQINPKKRVPVLSLHGNIVTKVPAITTTLADETPEGWLMGGTLLDKARVHEWMNWLSGALHGQGRRPMAT